MVDRRIVENSKINRPSGAKDSDKKSPSRAVAKDVPSFPEKPSSEKLEDTRTSVRDERRSNKTLPTQVLNSEIGQMALEGAPQGKAGKGGTAQISMVGKVIDHKFKVIRVIGEGGMGVVYEAEHLQLKKHFAIKSIRSQYTRDPDFNKRFDREAKTQARLQHPNIIQVTDFIKENGQFFMVMEYVQGNGLDTLIKEKKISEEKMLSILKDILKGLGHAHHKGIIHRDIKASNIIIAQDETAKLMDFGIALLAGERQDGNWVIAGTPPYMSPEQINRPAAMDHRTDIYSVGILMFEMLCGKRPFDGKSIRETQMNHIRQKLPEIKSLFPESAPEISHILKKSLEKKPEKRFGDCREFLESIEAYERQTHLECRGCKFMNRVQNKYKLKGEKCVKCGRTLSMKSRFTKIWASAFALAATIILVYLLYPWPGSLVVSTTPEKAEIFINGDRQGVSPFETSLAPGEYEVLIKKENFETVVRQVHIKKNEQSALNIDIPKPEERQRIAYDTIKKAYQATAYICRDLNELSASENNLKIAESIGDSALMDAYQQQIEELRQNVDDGFNQYVDSFKELKAIKPEMRNTAYGDYVQFLKSNGGNIENLMVVWRHFEQYVNKKMSKAKWKTELQKFC